jgi:hypothetical protein
MMINSFVLRNVDLNTLMNDKDTERDPIKQSRECFEIKKTLSQSDLYFVLNIRKMSIFSYLRKVNCLIKESSPTIYRLFLVNGMKNNSMLDIFFSFLMLLLFHRR